MKYLLYIFYLEILLNLITSFQSLFMPAGFVHQIYAYNGANSDLTQTAPDWQRLRRQFSRIILETPFDYRKQLAFGILYIEERPKMSPAC